MGHKYTNKNLCDPIYQIRYMGKGRLKIMPSLPIPSARYFIDKRTQDEFKFSPGDVVFVRREDLEIYMPHFDHGYVKISKVMKISPDYVWAKAGLGYLRGKNPSPFNYKLISATIKKVRRVRVRNKGGFVLWADLDLELQDFYGKIHKKKHVNFPFEIHPDEAGMVKHLNYQGVIIPVNLKIDGAKEY